MCEDIYLPFSPHKFLCHNKVNVLYVWVRYAFTERNRGRHGAATRSHRVRRFARQAARRVATSRHEQPSRGRTAGGWRALRSANRVTISG